MFLHYTTIESQSFFVANPALYSYIRGTGEGKRKIDLNRSSEVPRAFFPTVKTEFTINWDGGLWGHSDKEEDAQSYSDPELGKTISRHVEPLLAKMKDKKKNNSFEISRKDEHL